MHIGCIKVKFTAFTLVFGLLWLALTAFFTYACFTVNIFSTIDELLFCVGGGIVSVLAIAFNIYFLKKGDTLNMHLSMLMLATSYYLTATTLSYAVPTFPLYSVLATLGTLFVVVLMSSLLVIITKRLN